MNDAAIQVKDLVYDYGTHRALSGLNVEVEAGDVVALLGPNGAGKTTLLRSLAGLTAPTEGSVRVLGCDPWLQQRDLAGLVAPLLDGAEPAAWATAQGLFALQRDASPNFDTARAEEMCRSHGVPLRAGYGTLSKGQRRWVLACATVASGAPVLLLDEPADGLDPAARRRLYDALRDLANTSQTTILIATHIIHDIERIADEVAIIAGGRALLHENLEDLREHVREVDVGDRLPAGAVVLTTGEDVALVRHNGSGGPPAGRTVNLEELYLALTSTQDKGEEA